MVRATSQGWYIVGGKREEEATYWFYYPVTPRINPPKGYNKFGERVRWLGNARPQKIERPRTDYQNFAEKVQSF